MDLCCPNCRGPVDLGREGYRCPPCRRLYPIVCGIPDFRASLPHHFNRAADLQAAEALAEEEHTLDFEALAHLYFRLKPEPSEELHEKHMAHVAGEEDQARLALDLIDGRRALEPADAVLEVGCGLGQYLAAAAERVEHLAGVDVSLAALVLTRKRLGRPGLLVAAEAEHLPFPDGAFAAAMAADVLEHLEDPGQALAEMGRVLKPGAPLFLSTPNRFSLAPEPHVGLWGVGYLPRRWANRYVRWRLGIFYDDVRTLSALALRRLLRSRFPGAVTLLIPGLSPRQLERFPPTKRFLARLYLGLRGIPLARPAFYLFGPFFHALGVRR